jgi:hypothetical protein
MPESDTGNEDSAREKIAPVPVEPDIEARANEAPQREIGGPAGPEPTRYGDWERNGRCTDF